jgi:hypothetical protein
MSYCLVCQTLDSLATSSTLLLRLVWWAHPELFLFSFFTNQLLLVFLFFLFSSSEYIKLPTWDEKGDKLPHVVLFLLYRWRGTAESSFSILPGPPPKKKEEEENKYVGFFLFLSPSINVISYRGGLAWVLCVYVCVPKRGFRPKQTPPPPTFHIELVNKYTHTIGWCICHVKASGSYGYIYLILRAVCSV